MPRQKTDVLKRLTRSHLEAIGRVAASWSQLEWAMILTLSEISDVHIYKTIALAAPSAFASWVDMIIVLIRSGAAHKDKEDVLEKLFKLLKKLLTLRNNIVHATWSVPEKSKGTGLIGSAMNPEILTPYDKASGMGLPKRGRDVIIKVEWTPKQMRQVASLIEEARLILLGISYLKPATSLQTLSEHMQKRQTILLRIQKMLDILPDPFQKLPKTRRAP